MTQNAVWYRLKSGPVFDAAWEVIKNHQEMDTEQKHRLGKILGQTSGVLRKDQFYGVAMIYPEFFADPYGGRDLYVLSPIGLDAQTTEFNHFKPDDGKEITTKERKLLETALFAPHGGSLPVICRTPLSKDTFPQKPTLET